MSKFAAQDSLGSPASFGAFPGELATLFSNRKLRKPEKPDVRYTYAYVVEAYALRPRETLEIIEVRDEDERAEVAGCLGDRYVDLNRERPVVICSTPVSGSRREL